MEDFLRVENVFLGSMFEGMMYVEQNSCQTWYLFGVDGFIC